MSKHFVSTALRSLRPSSTPFNAVGRGGLAASRLPLRSAVGSKSLLDLSRSEAASLRWLTSSSLRRDENSLPLPAETSHQSQAASPEDGSPPPSVYLSNLSFTVTEENLTEFLKNHVPVKKVDVVRNNDGAARGFGFAKFESQADAEAAVHALNGLNFLGRQIVAAISHRRPVIADASNQLFMSGFPTQGEVDEAALRRALQDQLGVQPRVIRFHRFPGGFLKGTGHLEFENVATLEMVLAKLQELGPSQPVSVNGHVLSLVKARPLLQSRRRVPGLNFAPTRGRGGFNGSGYGAQQYAGGQYGGGYGGYQGGASYEGQQPYGGPAYGSAPGYAQEGYEAPPYGSPYQQPPPEQNHGGYDPRGNDGNSGNPPHQS